MISEKAFEILADNPEGLFFEDLAAHLFNLSSASSTALDLARRSIEKDPAFIITSVDGRDKVVLRDPPALRFEKTFFEETFIVLDFETTGLSPKKGARVIEIGAAKIESGKIRDTFHTLVDPGLEVPYYITKITGIKTSDLSGAPSSNMAFSRFIDFFGASTLVAHNAAFDMSFLKMELERMGTELKNRTYCTVKLGRRVFPGLPSYSLGNLTSHFSIEHKDKHRGLSDATATAELFLIYLDAMKERGIADFEGIDALLASKVKKAAKEEAKKTPFVVYDRQEP